MVTEEAPEESGPEETVSDASPEAQTEDGFQIPSLDVDVPEDYAELGEMPDFDAEAEAEIQNEEPSQDEDYYEEPDTAALRKRALAAEKRNAWLEAQNIRQNEAKWQAEAIKFYPLAEPFIKAGKIKADSRRAYAREAKAVHEAMKPFISERFLEPLKAALADKEGKAKEEAQEEQKAAWGKPMTGPNQVPVTAERAGKKESIANQHRNNRGPTLQQEILAMIQAEEV